MSEGPTRNSLSFNPPTDVRVMIYRGGSGGGGAADAIVLSSDDEAEPEESSAAVVRAARLRHFVD